MISSLLILLLIPFILLWFLSPFNGGISDGDIGIIIASSTIISIIYDNANNGGDIGGIISSIIAFISIFPFLS